MPGAANSNKKNRRVCKQGHIYYKSSDCPTCPVCEAAKKPSSGFMASLSAPARRALESAGIDSLRKLSRYSEAEMLKLHGFGPASLPTLRAVLKSEGLSFKK
jgi:DNA-directed RNA polymerase alpha subunit